MSIFSYKFQDAIAAAPADAYGAGGSGAGLGGFARKQVKTEDGVTLSAIDTGEAAKPALVFIHGLSQSALCWEEQFRSAALRARYRLVALDLRGHGQSQGAFGAAAGDGRLLPRLDPELYCVPGNPAATSRLWAKDIDAVIGGLGLRSPALVGWSYGAVVICDYMSTHGGLGAASRVVLINTTPGLMPPGTPEVGGEHVFQPAVPPAVFRTLEMNLISEPPVPSTAASVIEGLTAFVELALSDGVNGRAAATRDEIVAAVSYNLQLPPAARQAIISREIDHRAFLASLPEADRKKIGVLCGGADAVMQSANTAIQFQRCGLSVDLIADEGHSFFARNPALFEQRLLHLLQG